MALVANAATSELLMAINARGVSLRRPWFFVQLGAIVG